MKKIAAVFSALLAVLFLAAAVSADVWYINPGPHNVVVGVNGVTYTNSEGNEVHADLPFGTEIEIESADGYEEMYPDNWKAKIPLPDGTVEEGLVSYGEYVRNLLERSDSIGPGDGLGERVAKTKAMVIADGGANQKNGPADLFYSGPSWYIPVPQWRTVEYEYVYGEWCYAEYCTDAGEQQTGWLRLSDLQTVVETEPPVTEPPAPDPVPDPVPDPDPTPDPDPEPVPAPDPVTEPVVDPAPETTAEPETEPVETEESTNAVLPVQTEDGSAGSESATEKSDEQGKKPGTRSVGKTVLYCIAAAVVVSVTALVIILIVVKRGRKPADDENEDQNGDQNDNNA
ncbi:MAG: hypothetical protein IJM71_01475 [Clostridia bacterium]|nr:hypothetical protein [Clostridia bacterium]